MLAGNLFLLSNIFLCLAGFCAYRLYEIGPWAKSLPLSVKCSYKIKVHIQDQIAVNLNMSTPLKASVAKFWLQEGCAMATSVCLSQPCIFSFDNCPNWSLNVLGFTFTDECWMNWAWVWEARCHDWVPHGLWSCWEMKVSSKSKPQVYDGQHPRWNPLLFIDSLIMISHNL